MRAAVLTEPRADLRIEERDRPEPGPGQVLVRVRACGVCHSDLALQEGHYPFAVFPTVPGHEVAGTVEALGDGVQWPEVGTRVGIPWLYSACGHCRQCTRGNEILCEAGAQVTGVTVEGGYQDFMLAPAAFVAPLPDALEFAAAAPLMCAGVTVFNGLRVGGYDVGDRVAVIGLGGLGHLGVRFARAMGARVAVVSSSPDKEPEARELGAEVFISGADPGKQLAAWDGGANVILATAPATDPATATIPGLAPDGTLVLLGIGAGEVRVSPGALVAGRRRIMGSPSGSRHDLRETLAFAAAHGVLPDVITCPLEEANDALGRMRSGKASGRAVLTME
jgi:D-arabinose 1-dehydrogenase-like Zn-dependent alcohol dehydrogenase